MSQDKNVKPSSCITTLIVIIVVVATISYCSNGDDKEASTISAYETKELKPAEPTPPQVSYPTLIKKEIEKLDYTLDRANNRRSKDAILAEVYFFQRTANVILNASDTLSSPDKELLNILKKKLIKIQKEDFSILRKNYVKWSAQKVWEENMDIMCGYEDDCSTITIIAAGFADRKNIVSAHGAIVSALELLRFKRVKYKWHKYDSDYTYFDLKTPADSDVTE